MDKNLPVLLLKKLSLLPTQEVRLELNNELSQHVIEVANTKFDKKGIITSSPIKDVDILITNKKPNEIYINLFKSNNIKLIY